eukprot:1618254-Pyramimonas_sp.AAC.1
MRSGLLELAAGGRALEAPAGLLQGHAAVRGGGGGTACSLEPRPAAPVAAAAAACCARGLPA